MEDSNWQIPGTILTTTENKKEKPQSFYWTGAALSYGFWAVILQRLLSENASGWAQLGMMALAVFFGAGGWIGVGAAFGLVVALWGRSIGAW